MPSLYQSTKTNLSPGTEGAGATSHGSSACDPMTVSTLCIGPAVREEKEI